MDRVPGFVVLPRLAGFPRPAGAFFSAVVVSPAGPGTWLIRLDGRNVMVQTGLELTAGQALRLKLVRQSDQKLEFRVLESGTAPPRQADSSLALAFLSRGLAATHDKLNAWSRWMQKPGPSDQASWAASLEARGFGPHSPLADAIEPWLLWQAALERGNTPPAPEEEVWDEWNLRRTAAGDPWIVLPLHWEYRHRRDSGLLQAHWNPPGQLFDRWQVTAAPGGTPFRLEAKVNRGLELTWRFFRPGDLRAMEAWFRSAPELGTPELPVVLTLAGPPDDRPRPKRGIDVEV